MTTTNVREALPYSTPMELWQAFKRGEKFVLHYHGRAYDVTNMSPRDKVVYVQPPGLPVKVFPDGSNCESAGDAIWLGRAPVPHPSPAPQSAEVRAQAGGVPKSLLDALRYYANGEHFMLADESAWDTVSGEPPNLFCDEAGTATVEDGSIAAMALRGEAVGWIDSDGDYTPKPINGDKFTTPSPEARETAEPIGFITEEALRLLRDPEWLAQRGTYANLWGTDGPPNRAIVPVFAAPVSQPEALPLKSMNWHPGPIKTEWGDGMLVADVELSPNETLTMFIHKNALPLLKDKP